MQHHLLFEMPEPRKLHLGVTGSIAAYKTVDIMRNWQRAGLDVSVTLTQSAEKFISSLTFESLGANPVYKGMFDEPLSHLAPQSDCDAIVIAPASADTIAQIASGRADTLLAAQVLAFTGKIVLAPAMNTHMWHNEATQENIRILQDRGMIIVPPTSGKLACNEEGEGKLARDIDIYLHAIKAVTKQDFFGKTVMVTLGATQEKFDDVRIWTNKSTGTMGMSLAIAAWLRGAHVHAICGSNVHLDCPDDELFEKHTAQSASQMLKIAKQHFEDADYGIFTAAVADFRPEEHIGKFKKSSAPDGFSLEFYPNDDILKSLAKDKEDYQKVIAFAAESAFNQDELAELAIQKMHDKNADMVVANTINDGFATENNKVFVADYMSREEHWPQLPKPEVAWNLLTWALDL